MKIRLTSLAIATGIAAVAGAGLMDSTAPEAVAPTVTQGMTVVIDKDSGAFRAPTAKEAAEFATSAPQAAAAATEIRRADGSKSMRLDDSYMTYSTVTRNADGTWTKQCGVDHDHAMAHSTAGSTAARAVK
ncbi:MAG: hypothetical protein AB8G17_14130 [Gammaproteobacteria bacterium]